MTKLTRREITSSDARLKMKDDPRRLRRLTRLCFESVRLGASFLQRRGQLAEWPRRYPKEDMHAISRQEMRKARRASFQPGF